MKHFCSFIAVNCFQTAKKVAAGEELAATTLTEELTAYIVHGLSWERWSEVSTSELHWRGAEGEQCVCCVNATRPTFNSIYTVYHASNTTPAFCYNKYLSKRYTFKYNM